MQLKGDLEMKTLENTITGRTVEIRGHQLNSAVNEMCKFVNENCYTKTLTAIERRELLENREIEIHLCRNYGQIVEKNIGSIWIKISK